MTRGEPLVPTHTHVPLYIILGELAGLWVVANGGYFFLLPVFGIQISYNSSPIAIACYFAFWAGVSIFYFWSVFRRWLFVDERIWVYLVMCLGVASLVWGLLYLFTLLPILKGLPFVPYTDILFATPWYFLPKSLEVLVQQVLIVVLVLELQATFRSLTKVIIAYFICFGGAHAVLFFIYGVPAPYAAVLTVGSLVSTAFFPYLILRVKGGFVYTYAIHLLFYICLALVLHAWPPPGYLG